MDGNGIEATGVRRRTVGSWQCARSLLAVVALTASAVAGAGTATGTFTVQATIASACLVTATTLNFGTYGPTSSTALTGTSTVSINCTSGSPYTAELNVGSGGGSFTGRTLLNGINTLTYNLYRDAAYSQVWGDGSGSTYTVAGTGSGLLTANTVTVYGQIPISQDKPVGAYSSLITVTISY
jgi:spore coat protein U-like protein